MQASLMHERPAAAPLASDSGRQLGVAAALGLMTALIRGIHLDHLKQGTILMHPYYAGFYLANYQDGFRRRALVGSVLRLLFPHAVNAVWLNLLALLVLGVLLAVGLMAFVRLSERVSVAGRVLAFAFCASPIVASQIEVVGDTLQIAFLGLIALILLSANSLKSYPLRLTLGLLSLVAGFFIHEASIFFITPCIPFLVRRWPRFQDFILPGLTATACLLLAIHWSNLTPHLTYEIKLFHFAGQLVEQPDTPGFRALLHLEHQLYFGSRSAELSFVMKCVKMLSLIFVALVALVNCFPTRNLKRVLYTLAFMAVFSLPLFFIAHDWGRFFSYSVLLAILLTAFVRYPNEAVSTQESAGRQLDPLDRIVVRMQTLAHLEYVQLAAIFLLLVTVGYDNFEHLMLTPDVLGFLAILVAGFGYRRLYKTEPIS